MSIHSTREQFSIYLQCNRCDGAVTASICRNNYHYDLMQLNIAIHPRFSTAFVKFGSQDFAYWNSTTYQL